MTSGGEGQWRVTQGADRLCARYWGSSWGQSKTPALVGEMDHRRRNLSQCIRIVRGLEAMAERRVRGRQGPGSAGGVQFQMRGGL